MSCVATIGSIPVKVLVVVAVTDARRCCRDLTVPWASQHGRNVVSLRVGSLKLALIRKRRVADHFILKAFSLPNQGLCDVRHVASCDP
jgi:hypothetical protein